MAVVVVVVVHGLIALHFAAIGGTFTCIKASAPVLDGCPPKVDRIWLWVY